MIAKRTVLVGLLALGLATLAHGTAWAAGYDAPPWFSAVIWLSVLLILGVPAMGLGYVFAGFLTLRASIGCVLLLALVPTILAWTLRGIDVVIALVPFQLMLLVMLGPLFVWGWGIGHRDMKRQAARQAAYENGN